MSLFASPDGPEERHEPLADRLRPRDFDGFFGQDELVGEGRLLRRLIEGDRFPSLILWGPPGCGKTTLAKIVAERTGARFVFFSAVLSGKAEVRKVMDAAKRELREIGARTILFIDEIHRFNKAQQDAFLPYVEEGTITLIGATTENPSFEVNAALLSRCRVFLLKPLDEAALAAVLDRALADGEDGLGERGVAVTDGARAALLASADGDARRLLNLLEASALVTENVTEQIVTEALQRKTLAYDKAGEEHYNVISALHKSLRGSDVQAGLYWLGRMLEAGEDPLYIVRRLIRFASEDVGVADPQALVQCNAAKDAVHFLGMPEGALALAQAVVYLATAPKSNSLYKAYGRVQKEIASRPAEPVPMVIRNAPTSLMADLGFGEGYKYPHDYVEGVVRQEYLPDGVAGREFYRPGGTGFEREIAKRMAFWGKLRAGGKERKSDDA
ncbi:MAG: replication-associated recombination protein A [Planctomycetota bacterium]